MQTNQLLLLTIRLYVLFCLPFLVVLHRTERINILIVPIVIVITICSFKIYKYEYNGLIVYLPLEKYKNWRRICLLLFC